MMACSCGAGRHDAAAPGTPQGGGSHGDGARQDPPPADPNGLGPLARRIVQRVAALGDRFPSLRGADPALRQIDSLDTTVEPWQPRFMARWDHEHEVTMEPDPTFVPSPYTARSPFRSRLDPVSGLQLTLWLYEGAWMQLVEVRPFEIGRLRIVSFIRATNPELRTGIDGAIQEILESERAATTR